MPELSYNHSEIEKKWQNYWDEHKIFAANDRGRQRQYVLDMFPYPSAQGLHVGHVEGYGATDIYCRYLRMTGVNILHPMGWDAFGLPAENYAIKTGRSPQDTTRANIENIRHQLKSLGLAYDWSREVNTSDPEYYKWTQWLFLQLYRKGLAYQKEAPVNWCPSCQTVLANEQVIDGTCERCHTKVEQRQMKQWFFKITDYADKLLNGLDKLDWPTPIMEMQKNWIGESKGVLVRFPLISIDMSLRAGIDMSLRAERSNLVTTKTGDRPAPSVGARDDSVDDVVEIFTTRLDTIFGATFLVISPELAQKWIDVGWQVSSEIKKYMAKALPGKESERLERAAKQKTGVNTGIKARNPATNEDIPVWVADYVLGSYGTGAIMAVPAHDQRDWEFAQKFNLPIKQVIIPTVTDVDNPPQKNKKDTVRQVVHVILRNPKNKKILLSFLKDSSWGDHKPINFIIGGIEASETPPQAAIREIKEETGYDDISFVKELPFMVSANFFQAQKDLNRKVYVHTMIFDLKSERQQSVKAAEVAKHDFKWVDQNQVGSNLNIPDDSMSWKYYQAGGFAFSEMGELINSEKFSGLTSHEAVKKIAKAIGAKLETQYKLRDWLISRQRYWGAPIPIIHCSKCGPQAVLEKDLPVVLPNDVDFKPHGESPLARSKEFHRVNCPKCGAAARRESDTMDTFVDSSWYWLRYCDPVNHKAAFDGKKVSTWCPVNLYVGGAEHAVLHLLYARFITKALCDMEFIKFDEPFLKLRNQGLILGEDGQKMSKSRGNVVNPDEVVTKYGADTLRLYEMFMGPVEDAKPWNTNSIIGVRRFLDRVWKLADNAATADLKKREIILLDKATKKVTGDIENFKVNTVVSSLMELSNELAKLKPLPLEALKRFLILLYPLAPHISSEMWSNLNLKKNIWEEPWPTWNAKNLLDKEISIVVQVNGSKRSTVNCAPGSSQKIVQDLALADTKVAQYLVGRPIKRVVFVKDRLINLVVS